MVKKLNIKSFYFDFCFDLNIKIKSNFLTFNLNHQKCYYIYDAMVMAVASYSDPSHKGPVNLSNMHLYTLKLLMQAS